MNTNTLEELKEELQTLERSYAACKENLNSIQECISSMNEKIDTVRKQSSIQSHNIFPGNVYNDSPRDSFRVVVLQLGYAGSLTPTKFYIAGLGGTLDPYSNMQSATAEEMADHLTRRGYKLIGKLDAKGFTPII